MAFDKEALAAKHGRNNLRLATVTNQEDETFEFVLKKPNRSVVQALNACQGDEDKASKILITNIVIEGDMEALEDGEVYIALLEECGKLFKKANVEIKKF